MKVSVGRVLMLVENRYPADVRVRNEAELLSEAGYEVSVISLSKPGEKFTEVVNGVRVFRMPRLTMFSKTSMEGASLLRRIINKCTAILGYVIEYGYFSSGCLLLSLWVGIRYGFDVLHAHNPPDTLFAVAAVHKLVGRKFVFDHHDLCPELYQSRYGVGQTTMVKILAFVELCSLKLANMTIATNESYKAIQIQRGGVHPEDVAVVRNGPNEHKMRIPAPSPRLRGKGKAILVYIGCLNPQDGVDYLIRSIHLLVTKLKRTDFYCVVMGSGDSLDDLQAMVRELNLSEYVELTGYIAEADLVANLSAADICVDPDPSSPLNDVSTWIKIMEYMAFAKPIVTFDLKETRFSAQESALYVKPNDELAFAQGIADLIDRPDDRKRMGDFGRKRVENELQWRVVGQKLLQGYARLLPNKVPPGARAVRA